VAEEAQSQPAAPGELVGRYQIIEVLGRGGMGTVYAAHDPGLDRRVALKLIDVSREQQRLIREAKALAKLAHPNVVAVHEAGTYQRRTFLAMELVDGWTLRRWIEQSPRTWRDIVAMYTQAARGLAAAHNAGLVHRDFKPDNVLVGRDGRARVLDFGLVSEAGASTPAPAEAPILDEPRLTQTGAVMGTPAYMAPEQFVSSLTDARTDQFAFAIALWEALYGVRPFMGAGFAGLMIAVCQGEIGDAPLDRGVPSWLERILRRALSVDPAARYPSMEALIADLRVGAQSGDARVPLGGGRYEPIEGPGDGVSARRLMDRLTQQVVTLQPVVTDGMLRDPVESKLALSRDFMALMALDHPHIVKVLDFGIDDHEQPYFVLEAADHAEGFIEAARRAPPSIQKNFVAQLLGALGYLHRRDLVHGHLTPAHLRVTVGQLKLFVLGSAALPGPTQDEQFMAPELRRGQPPSAVSDLWTFGVIARRVLEPTPALTAALDRITAADAAERPQSASEVAEILGQALGSPMVLDTAETRESFLQSARFAGRDRELSQLKSGLLSAVHGHGSAWLIGGESGVGKSRLLDELRAFAHVQGAVVVRGQEESTAGGPYALWRDALRAMVVVSELSDFDASILLPIIPDLPRILGRPVTAAPLLDGLSMGSRLREVVLRVLKRQARPVLVLLEDLHWSGSDTLDLVRAILPAVSGLPLMVVATYRHDERPDLPDALAGMTPMVLSRLGTPAITALVSSMIGASDPTPSLISLIERESEGNAFFLVEIVRALAEGAGGVDQISKKSLPDSVRAGRMQRILRRRLEKLPPGDIRPLRLAAVQGRRIDAAVLAKLAPELDLERWVRTGIDAAVLERKDGAVRFAHDKLREELLGELSADDRRALHAEVAAGIEAVHGATSERHAALAMHHAGAGNAAEEARYVTLAGETALLHGAHQEAVVLLSRALALSSSVPPLERARLHNQLGYAQFFLMDFARAEPSFRAAAREAGVEIPVTGRLGFLLRQMMVQAAHRVRGVEAAFKPELLEASRAAARLANLHIFENDRVGVLASSLLAVNLAERAGATNHLSLALLGFAAGAVGWKSGADAYFARIHADLPGDADVRGLASGAVAEISAYIGRAELDRAERAAADNIALCERIGDRLNLSYTQYALGIAAYYRGALDEALMLLTTAQTSLDPSLTRHGAVGFASQEILIATTLGRIDQARARLEATRSAFSRHDRLSEGIWHGVRALVEARAGQLEEAQAAVSQALRCVPAARFAPPTGGGMIYGMIETALLAYSRNAALVPEARKALRYGQSWARAYPIGRPHLAFYRGQMALIAGDNAGARRCFEEAVRLGAAIGAGLPVAQAELALSAIGPTSAEVAEHKKRAGDALIIDGGLDYLAGTVLVGRRAIQSKAT